MSNKRIDFYPELKIRLNVFFLQTLNCLFWGGQDWRDWWRGATLASLWFLAVQYPEDQAVQKHCSHDCTRAYQFCAHVTFKVKTVDCFLHDPCDLVDNPLQIYTQRVGEELSFLFPWKIKCRYITLLRLEEPKRRKKGKQAFKNTLLQVNTGGETASRSHRLFVPKKPAAASSCQGGFPKISEVFWGFPCGVKSCWPRSRYEVCSGALLLRESHEVFLNMCISPGMNPFSFVKWTASWESRPP